MKKLLALLVMALMASPLFAASTITISAVDAGSGILRVSYTVDAASDSDPVGMALNFASSAATTVAADVTNVDPLFPVYLDYAHDAGSGYNFEPVTGSPLAISDAAGVPAAAVQNFAICVGRLGQAAPTKGAAHVLCDIKLTAVGAATETFVTISADSLRGGVVGSTFVVNVPGTPVRVGFGPSTFILTTSVVGGVGGTIAPATGPQAVGSTVNLTATPASNYIVKAWTGTDTVATNKLTATVIMTSAKTVTVEFEQECMKTTNPKYSDWVSFGRPACWCYKRHCRGDINNAAGLGTKWVSSADLTAFKAAYDKTPAELALIPNGICADINHTAGLASKRVTSADLTTFKFYYDKTQDIVTICDMTYYNFWK